MKKKIIGGVIFIAIVFVIVMQLDFKSPEAYYNQDEETSILKDSEVEYRDNQTSQSTLNGKLQNTQNDKDEENNKVNNKETNKKTDINKSETSKDEISVNVSIDLSTFKNDKAYAKLKPELRKYVPASGYVLKNQKISINDGASAFDVLQKATRINKIPMAYQGGDVNLYNSIYIEGINHIFEFSAGNESGWMYSINNTFPSYGMSQFYVKNNDNLKLVYTTDLGCDVGHSMKKC